MSFIQNPFKAFDQHVFIVTAVVALIGCVLVICGCTGEAMWQSDLLHSGGWAALDAYTNLVASHQLPVSAFMVESLTGHCFAHGAVLVGAGFWVVFVVSPLVAVFYAFVRASQLHFRLPARGSSGKHPA